MCVDCHNLSNNPCHCWDTRRIPFIFPNCSTAAEAVAQWPHHSITILQHWLGGKVIYGFPAPPLFFNPFNIDWCGSLTTASFSRIECEPTLWPLQVPGQLKGGEGYANSMIEEVYFLHYLQILKISAFAYSLPHLLGLLIYIYPSNCTDSWIQFLVPCLQLLFTNFTPNILPLPFLYYLLLLISECSSLISPPVVQFSSCRVLHVLPCMLATLVCISGFTCCPTSWHHLSETSFDKNTTWKDRGLGIRKVSNEYEGMSKNKKTENRG